MVSLTDGYMSYCSKGGVNGRHGFMADASSHSHRGSSIHMYTHFYVLPYSFSVCNTQWTCTRDFTHTHTPHTHTTHTPHTHTHTHHTLTHTTHTHTPHTHIHTHTPHTHTTHTHTTHTHTHTHTHTAEVRGNCK